MKKMGKILPVEAVVGAAMLKNKGWLRGRICFENEVVYTVFSLESVIRKIKLTVKNRKLRKGHLPIWSERSR